jgi:hypothetical protein
MAMKIRHGFVSNSSTTSFAVHVSEYASVFDVVCAMIPKREYPEDADEKLIKEIKHHLYSGLITKDTPLIFSSCNYDTHIIKHGEYYLIATCHNHPFDELKGFRGPIMLQALNSIGAIDREDLEYKILDGRFDFWFVRYGLMGHEVNTYCAKCSKPYIEVTQGPLAGKVICVDCLLLKISTIFPSKFAK